VSSRHGRGRRGDDPEPHLHVIHNLQRAEERTEGRETEIALLERKISENDDSVRLVLVVHGHGEGARPVAHRDLHVSEPLPL
jgi:hypothetical protein